MFNKLSKVKQNAIELRNSKLEKKASIAEKIGKKESAVVFLENLNVLSNMLFPYSTPIDRHDSGYYQSPQTNSISFKTRENRYSKQHLFKQTGLTTIRCVGGFGFDRWEADLSEYEAIYESKSSREIQAIKSNLGSIQTKIELNKDDYSNFVDKYIETLINTINIIEQFGMNFILSDDEIFSKIKYLLTSFIDDFNTYTETIRLFKKNQLLEKITLEQKYVDKMIDDSIMMLEFHQK